jgi:hypothetical protein
MRRSGGLEETARQAFPRGSDGAISNQRIRRQVLSGRDFGNAWAALKGRIDCAHCVKPGHAYALATGISSRLVV